MITTQILFGVSRFRNDFSISGGNVDGTNPWANVVD